MKKTNGWEKHSHDGSSKLANASGSRSPRPRASGASAYVLSKGGRLASKSPAGLVASPSTQSSAAERAALEEIARCSFGRESAELVPVTVYITPGMMECVEADMKADGRKTIAEHVCMMLERNHQTRVTGDDPGDEGCSWWRGLWALQGLAAACDARAKS